MIALERDLVVEIATRRCDDPSSIVSSARRSCGSAVSPAVEEDQHPIVGCQMDLGAVPVCARLVLPFAGAELAFEVDLGAFCRYFSAIWRRRLALAKAGMQERDGDRSRPRLPEGTGRR